MQSESNQEMDPFIIVRNYRKVAKGHYESGHPKRHHRDYSTLPHSIIITRRMAADIEHKKLDEGKLMP